MRKFEVVEAKRSEVPLLVGLVGASGSGKTYSALRLAVGIQRVVGGDIYAIDTEQRRASHYAFDPKTGEGFKFKHLHFEPPYSPADYLAAMQHCVKQGAKVIIVDSATHEHAGIGGVLEMHAEAHKKMGGGNNTKMLAWNEPKRERRRMIDGMLQLPCHFIMCWRAKDKLKIEKGKDPEAMGFMPVTGEEWVFEMTVNFLLYPNCKGAPTFTTKKPGEQLIIKVPGQFEAVCKPGQQLNESMGEAMARWAAGDGTSPRTSQPRQSGNGVARFGSRLQWEGAADWAGQPLADAPSDTLCMYRNAVCVARDANRNPKLTQQFNDHIDAINKAIAEQSEDGVDVSEAVV